MVFHDSAIYEHNGRKWKLQLRHSNPATLFSLNEKLHADPMRRNLDFYLTYIDGPLPTAPITFKLMAKSLTAASCGWQSGLYIGPFDTENNSWTSRIKFTLQNLQDDGCYDAQNDDLTLGAHVIVNDSPADWIAASAAKLQNP